jgi:hypothetical protein
MSLFAPLAQIRFAPPRADGKRYLSTYPVEGFLDLIVPTALANGRIEKELWCKVDRFGTIAHVWSAYELHTANQAGESVTRRGVNSFQLHFDGTVWRITSLIWDVETQANPLPEGKEE